MNKQSPFFDKFTAKFLNDISRISVGIDDAVLFLTSIFRHYDREPGKEQYKIELERFLKSVTSKSH